MSISHENNVYERLQGKHHLRPVFSGGCYDLARRIREYDPAMFIVWNTRKQRYEVHSLNHYGNTFAMTVPNNRLDARLEEEIRKGDLRVRGNRIFREVDEHNERLEMSAERARHNDMLGMAEEMYPYFRRLGWEGI